MTQFDLVIFDCDGVLVDSERLTNAVFADMLNELGLSFSLDDMFREFVGRSMTQCLEKIETLLGTPVPESFADEYGRRTEVAMRDGLRPVAGIEAALDAISIPTCVASSGSHDKMRMTLGLTGLIDRFSGRLFSVTEVSRGKPHPDVFLYAAEQMRSRPERCAVVEDTAIGAQAGNAAGMTVFGYAELTDPAALAAEGAIVFDEMSRLPSLLASG